MSNDASKMIEDYILQKRVKVYDDQSQLWTAEHKILKRQFTLRKVPLKGNSTIRKSQLNQEEESTDNYERTIKVTNILKRLNLNVGPKHRKAFKSNNNLYVVYDFFPSTSLKQYLLTHQMTTAQKRQMMIKMARMVSEIHKKSTLVLNLNPENVYLFENGDFFVQNWDYSIIINSAQENYKFRIKSNIEYVAEQIKKSSICGFSSDIYSLGKIFKEIHNSGSFQENQYQKKIDDLITGMTDNILVKRPNLNEVIKVLEMREEKKQMIKMKKYESMQQKIQTPKSKTDLKVKKAKSGQGYFTQLSQNKNSQFLEKKNDPHTKTLKHIGVGSKITRLNTAETPTNESLTQTPSQFRLSIPCLDEVKTPLRKPTTKLEYPTLDVGARSLRLSKKSDKSKSDHEVLVQNITNKRSLAFLLTDLSEFVLRTDFLPELSYLLFKKAFLVLMSATEEWMKSDCESREDKKLERILRDECFRLKNILDKMKKKICQSLPKKEQDDKSLSEIFLKEKVKQFGKLMVFNCQKTMGKVLSSSKMVEILFKTYLILKILEEGRYENFWKKVSKSQYASLKNQRYLREEKRIGYRYLKSKIAEILSKK